VITVTESEWNDGWITVDSDITKIDIEIRGGADSAVKLEDHAGGSYYYFRSVDEIKELRDMLNKVLELNPVIAGRQPL